MWWNMFKKKKSELLNFIWWQSDTEQRPHKVSFKVDKDKAHAVTKSLAERLEKHGVILVF